MRIIYSQLATLSPDLKTMHGRSLTLRTAPAPANVRVRLLSNGAGTGAPVRSRLAPRAPPPTRQRTGKRQRTEITTSPRPCGLGLVGVRGARNPPPGRTASPRPCGLGLACALVDLHPHTPTYSVMFPDRDYLTCIFGYTVIHYLLKSYFSINRQPAEK